MLWTWSPAGGFGPVPCEALLGGGDWCLCSGGWSWILSLWRAVLHPVVCVGVSVNKVWHWDTPLLLSSVVFMFCWWFGIRRLALELSGLLCCMVLVLRWRPLGELLLFNIPWDWEFSHGATPWTQVELIILKILNHSRWEKTENRRQIVSIACSRGNVKDVTVKLFS